MKSAALFAALTVVLFVWVDHLLNSMGHSGFLAGFVQSMIK